MEEEQREAQTERERREEGKDTQRERLRDIQTQREAWRGERERAASQRDEDGNTETRKGCRHSYENGDEAGDPRDRTQPRLSEAPPQSPSGWEHTHHYRLNLGRQSLVQT